jgi:hypothetical protein
MNEGNELEGIKFNFRWAYATVGKNIQSSEASVFGDLSL